MEQQLRVAAVEGEGGPADSERYGVPVGRGDVALHPLDDSPADLLRLPRVVADQQGAELVPADAADDVVIGDLQADHLNRMTEELIPREVPDGVVQWLE